MRKEETESRRKVVVGKPRQSFNISALMRPVLNLDFLLMTFPRRLWFALLLRLYDRLPVLTQAISIRTRPGASLQLQSFHSGLHLHPRR